MLLPHSERDHGWGVLSKKVTSGNHRCWKKTFSIGLVDFIFSFSLFTIRLNSFSCRSSERYLLFFHVGCICPALTAGFVAVWSDGRVENPSFCVQWDKSLSSRTNIDWRCKPVVLSAQCEEDSSRHSMTFANCCMYSMCCRANGHACESWKLEMRQWKGRETYPVKDECMVHCRERRVIHSDNDARPNIRRGDAYTVTPRVRRHVKTPQIRELSRDMHRMSRYIIRDTWKCHVVSYVIRDIFTWHITWHVTKRHVRFYERDSRHVHVTFTSR